VIVSKHSTQIHKIWQFVNEFEVRRK